MVADFMLTKRATFWLCDSKTSELFKIALDKDGRDSMEDRHMAQKGICGYVANTHQSRITSNVEEENKFNADVDDPKGEGKTTDLLTCPVRCIEEEDASVMKAKGMHLPRGVIQVANKLDDSPFTEFDKQ